ncbi:MAG: MCE family protein [Bacteroidia bacterium]
MKISKEVKVGVLATMAIAMFVIGFNYLKGQNIFTSSNNYYGVYKKIDGLFESNPVLVNGYKVGHVSEVSMDNKTLELTVEISVPVDIHVPLNSKMRIVNNDMIGSKAIELILGDTNVLAKDGAVLISEQDAGITEAISSVLTPLSQSINRVIGDIDTAVSGADLETTLTDASLALRSFKETADKLNRMLDGKDEQFDQIFLNVEKTTSDLKGLAPKIDSIASQLERTSSSIAKIEIAETVEEINKLVLELNKTTLAINNGEGSLGKLLNEDELYEHLDATIVQLKSLLEDIEKYPSRYTGITKGQRKRADKEKDKDETN